jgi:hypothetical protein
MNSFGRGGLPASLQNERTAFLVEVFFSGKATDERNYPRNAAGFVNQLREK